MRNAKLLGIIAAVAVMGGLLISCGPEPTPSEPPPEGEVVLSADYGAFVGYPIKATPLYVKTTSGEVLIAWFKTDALVYANAIKAADETNAYTDEEYETYLGTITLQEFTTQDQATDSNSSTKGSMFRPAAAGSYVAGLVDSQAFSAWNTDQTTLSLPRFLFSEPISVTAVPNDGKVAFFGKWDMTNTFFPNDAPTTPAKETIKIGDKTFKLFLSIKNEGIQWDITSWTPITGNDLKGITITPATTNPAAPAVTKDFESGYTLAVTVIPGTNKGYTAFTTFKIYQSSTGETAMARTNNQGTVVRLYDQKVAPTSNDLLTDD